MNSKQRNAITYWERKHEAFEKFKEADERPQAIYRPYLLHRRQLNNGTSNDKWKSISSRDKIEKSVLSIKEFYQFAPTSQDSQHKQPGPPLTLPPLYSTSSVLINDECKFNRMQEQLEKKRVITLDLEANNEHSYLGMTCLIQIGADETDYLVDVFPIFEFIKNDLKIMLESTSTLKYMWGCANDALWLKRCFFINLVHVLDVQILFQEILRDGLWDQFCQHLPFEQKKLWYLKHIGPRNNGTSEAERHQWEKQASLNPMSYNKFVSIFYPIVKMEDAAQVADFRPRDPDDAVYKKLLKYARDDVHILHCIMKFITSQRIPEIDFAIQRAYEKTKIMLLKLYNPTTYPNSESYFKSKSAVRVPQNLLSTFKCIFDWRTHHASLIDESPAAMFSEHQLLSLLKDPSKDEHELESRVMTRENCVPESIQTWRSTLFQLVNEGEAYLKKIMSLQCHNCRKVAGHAAWGCAEPWSTESTKLNLKEDDEARKHQNRRRQKNKRQNKKMKKMQN